MTPDRPKIIVVMGHPLEVVPVGEKDDPLGERAMLGRVDVDQGKLWIDGGTKESAHGQRDTLFHEVVHAIFSLTRALDNHGRQEEPIVAVLATTILDTLRRNPELAAFLLAEEAADG